MYGLSQDSVIANAIAGGEPELPSRTVSMKGSFHRVFPAADGEMLLPFSRRSFEIVALGQELAAAELLVSSSFPAAECIGPFEAGLPESVGLIRRGCCRAETGSPPSCPPVSATRPTHSSLDHL